MTKNINIVVRSLKDLQDRIEAHIKFNTSSGHNHDGSNSRLISSLSSVGIKTGTATITAGNTFVDVTHNVSGIPTMINTPPTNIYGLDYYLSNIGVVTFRINIQVPQLSDATFIWSAGI